MKRYIGGAAALALLLAGCGSSETPTAETVTSTATQTVSEVRTASVVETVGTTSAVTITARPDELSGAACSAVGGELSRIDVLEAMQKWSGGGSLKVGDISAGILKFTKVVAKDAPPTLASLIDAFNSAAVRMRDADPADWDGLGSAVLEAWDAAASECVQNGTPIPNVQTVSKTVPKTVVKTVSKTVLETVMETAAVETVTAEITITEQAPVAAEPAPQGGQDVENGDYLVGSGIQPGTYQCADPGENATWLLYDSTGTVTGGDFGSIAIISSDTYKVQLNDCNGSWSSS